MTSPHDSIDDIIRRVREEARALPSANTSAEAAADTALFTPQPRWEPADSARAAQMRSKKRWFLEELLLDEGPAFIERAYLAVLGRAADPSGLNYYLGKMKQSGRLSVLAEMWRSPEGCARGASIIGMELPMKVYLADKVARRLRLRVGTGAILRKLDAYYTRKLAATRALLTQLETRNAEVDARFAANDARNESRQAALVDMNEKLQVVLRTLSEQVHEHKLDRLAQRDLQRQAAILLEQLAGLDGEQPAVAAWANTHLSDKVDLYYRAFEDANRGSLDDIRHKLSVYLPRFERLKQVGNQPVLDIGCGRGEWLQLLKEQGHNVRGVDLNQVMVKFSQEQGLDAVYGDAYAYLRSLPDASLLAVTGFHIIEHVPFDTLYGIFEEAFRVLVPGGIILFETPNPENVLVGSHTFYHDFTHRNPITPTAISFLAKYHQFEQITVERYNPYPEEAKVPGDDPLTARVNGHLCGPQDFAVIATKPALAAGAGA